MKITRDVVIDLLPLYESGEASADTRRLVEEFLQADQEFARLAKAARTAPVARSSSMVTPPDIEREAVRRTRKALRLQKWVMGFAIFFTLLPLSFGDISGYGTFFMLRDIPQSKYAWVVAALLWLVYFGKARRLRPVGW